MLLPSRLCNACNVVLLVWNIPTLNLVMPSAYIDRAREEHRRQADSLLKAEGRSILLEKENPEETNRSVLNRESFEERKDARVGRKGQRKLLSGPQPSRVTNGAHTTAAAELAYGFITGLYEANDFTFEISLPACGRMFGPITT